MNRSKRIWQRHEDALEALEEARDIDTKPMAGTSLLGGRFTATDPEMLELERKRVSLENSQTASLRTISGLLGTILLMVMLAGFLADKKDELMGDGPQVQTAEELKAMGKELKNLAGLEAVQNVFSQVLNPGGADPFQDKKSRAKSILMFGPPGCGKTEIAKSAAGTHGYNYLEVTGGKIIGSYVGQSAKTLRAYFAKAKANAPCILFFDEVETLLKARGGGKQSGHSEDDRTVSEFLTEMNTIFDNPDLNVIIVGATNLPESLDSAAVRRFHRRVYIPVPGKDGREKLIEQAIKKQGLNGANFTKKVMKELIQATYGFSSSNVNECIAAIAKSGRNAHLAKLSEEKRKELFNSKQRPSVTMSEAQIRQAMKGCKSTVTSSTLTGYRQWAEQFGEKAEEEDKPKEGEVRTITAFDLDDEERKMADRKVRPPSQNAKGIDQIVGMKDVKDRLLNAMLATVRMSEQSKTGAFRPIKNFILFGPPGTGKSVLAEAVAKTSLEQLKDELGDKQLHFINISAADVKGSHFGESEKNLNSWFRIAEAYQPSVLFIDEIDTLLINRENTQVNDGGASLSILGTFLQLMDGPSVNHGRQVLVLAATNRLDNIDSAALRRFVPLLMPLPDDDARRDFFSLNLYGSLYKDLQNHSQFNALKPGIEVMVKKSKGYSGADISRVVQVAKEFAYESALKKAKGKATNVKLNTVQIESIHLRYAFLVVEPSAKQEDINRCNTYLQSSQPSAELQELIAKAETSNEEVPAEVLQRAKAPVQEIASKTEENGIWESLKSSLPFFITKAQPAPEAPKVETPNPNANKPTTANPAQGTAGKKTTKNPPKPASNKKN